MKTVGAYEAKTHLSKLLDDVANGESIEITKHGVPVARLVPPDGVHRLTGAELVAKMREFRKGKTLDGLTIREMIEEGRM